MANNDVDVTASLKSAFDTPRDPILNTPVTKPIGDAALFAAYEVAYPPPAETNASYARYLNNAASSFSAPASGANAYAGDRYYGAPNIPYPSPAPTPQAATQPPPTPGPEVMPPPSFPKWADPLSELSMIVQARNKAADIRADLENSYAANDRFSDIGNKAFNSELNEQLSDIGLARAEPRGIGRLGANFKASLPSIGFGLGFAAMGIGSGVAASESDLGSGKYITPELMQKSANQALEPGLWSIGLTMAGSTLGPMGAMAGGMAGQAIGQGVAAFQGASLERQQSTRETAEMLVASLGEASAKVKEFSETISASGAAVKDLQSAVGTLASVSPLGRGVIGGAAGMVNALREDAGANYASVGGQLKNPALFNLAEEFGQNGRLSTQNYGALGMAAAINGDAEGLYQDNLASLRSKEASDPEYQADAKEWNLTKGMLFKDRANTAMKKMMARESQILAQPDPTVEANNQAFHDYGISRQARGIAEAGVMSADAGITSVSLRGGSAAEIARSAEPLFNSLNQASNAITIDLARLKKSLSDPRYAGDKGFLQEQISSDEATLGGYRNAGLGREREDRSLAVSEEESGYGLDYASRVLRGSSAVSMRSVSRSQQRFLTGEADNPGPWSPAERDEFRRSSLEIGYEQTQREYGQAEGAIGVRGAQAGLSLSRMQITGTPGQEREAALQVVQNILDLNKQLNAELEKGNLTLEQRQQKQAQIAQNTAEATIKTAVARRNQYAEEIGMLDDTLSIDTVGIGRQIRLGGSGSVDVGKIGGDYSAKLAKLQSAYDNEPNPELKSQYQRQLAGLRVEQQGFLDSSNVYEADVRTRMADMQGEGRLRRAGQSFDIAMEAPYMDGPLSNPFTSGLGLMASIRGDMARRDADFAKIQAERASKKKLGMWNDLAEEGYTANEESYKDAKSSDAVQMAGLEHKRLYAMFNAVPEMIAGSVPGGVGAGVISPAAASAWFMPSVVAGSHGPQRPMPQAYGAALEGGPTGGFMHAAMDSSSSGKSQDTQYLQRITAALEKLVSAHASGMASRPTNDLTGVINQTLANTFNVYNGR